jgi:hypothetical protein
MRVSFLGMLNPLGASPSNDGTQPMLRTPIRLIIAEIVGPPVKRFA